jgi:hypothetical protein
MPISNSKETIDERVLRLLGLEDVFDLDYDTYLTLLKEAMVKGRMPRTSIPTEEIELLTGEYKRVKTKTGRFSVKAKKISARNFSVGNSKAKISDKKQKALPGTAAISSSPIQKSFENSISTIASAVVSISETLKSQQKIDRDTAAYGRKQAEAQKRKLRETNLEKRFSGLKKAAEKIIAPVKSVLDRLIDFFVKIFLGRVVYKLIEWMGDPENQSKVKSIIRFIKDWWPALIGSYILFGTTFGRFTRGILKTIGVFVYRIGRVAIPKLLSIIRRNPKAALAAGLFTAGATVPAMFPGTVDEQERKTGKSGGSTEDKIRALEQQKANLNLLQRMQGVGAEIDEQISFLKTGKTSSYGFNGGGLVRGLLNKLPRIGYSSGGRVSGRKGTDTIPAMLTDGEFVMSRGAVQMFGADNLAAMNAAGGGTNRPSIIRGTTYAQGGGLVGMGEGGLTGRNPQYLIEQVVRGLAPQFGWANDLARRANINVSGVAGQLNAAAGSAFKGSILNQINDYALQAKKSGQNPLVGVQRYISDKVSQAAPTLQGALSSAMSLGTSIKDRATGVLKSVADKPYFGEEAAIRREEALMKSGELKPGESLTETTKKKLAERDAYVKSLYDAEKDKGFGGLLKKTRQDIENRGLLMDPFAALGLKEEGTEKFVEKMTGGRVKNLGAKITGLQYAAKGLLGPLGRAFKIDDRGSLGRYLKPAIEYAQSQGQTGVGAKGFGQGKYNELAGDKLSNLALGQFGFTVDKQGRAKTNDVYDSNLTAKDYFGQSRKALSKGDVGGALFKGLSGLLRVNQNTGWGNLRPGGSGIDLGGGFTSTEPKKQLTRAQQLYGENIPQIVPTRSKAQIGSTKPSSPSIKPPSSGSTNVTVVKSSPNRGGQRSGSRPTNKTPNITSSNKSKQKMKILGFTLPF